VKRIFFYILSAVAILICSWRAEAVQAKTTAAASVEYSLEKDLGYFIGDTVKVFYRITMPADLYIEEDTLPGEGGHGEGLDVREIKIASAASAGARTYVIEAVYQIFMAAGSAQTFHIPSFKFSYGTKEMAKAYVSELPPVAVTISPLTSHEDTFKPHILWSWISPTSRILRLSGAVLMPAGFAPAIYLLVRRGRKRSPFRAAWKRLSREKDPAAALVIFRNVLNEKAGKAIFPGNLNDLLLVFPEAKAYEHELLNLVLLSDEVSFNPKSVMAGNGLVGRISGTMKKLKRLETWS